MAATAEEILVQPGFLVWAPTSAGWAAGAGTFPYGGTDLGVTETGVRFNPGVKYRKVKGHETGERTLEKIYLGADPAIFATLKQWSEQNIQLAFPGLTVAGTAKRELHLPGAQLIGARASDNAAGLLFAPQETSLNRFVFFHLAVPNLEDTADLNFMLSEDSDLRVVFDALQDDSIGSGGDSYLYRHAICARGEDIAIP